MVPTEIWLRLMKVNGLYGDGMVMAARILHAAPVPDSEVLYVCGLSAAQAKQFLSVGQQELASTLLWLEQPAHHLLLADNPFYPPRLRAIADYPGALFVCGDLTVLSSLQLASSG